jgi:TonB family protein
MRRLLLILLPVVLSASCARTRTARQYPHENPASPVQDQNGNLGEAKPAAQKINCDFSAYKPLVSSPYGGPAISKPVPRYPSEAKEKGAGGAVAVKILINAESGRVEQACVVRGHELLAGAATAAGLQARFSPYLGGDRYVKEHYRYIESVITYNFNLQGPCERTTASPDCE